MYNLRTETITKLIGHWWDALAWRIGIGLCLVLLAGSLQAESPTTLHVGAFSRAQAGGPYPDSWKPLTFHKIDEHTEYSLVEDDGTVVVKAVSRGSSSGLTREVDIDPKEYPIVEWRWKIENVLQKSDVTTKEGDDYPARLYITFAYDESKIGFLEQAQYELAKLLHGKYPPTGAINYIWESRSPVGTIVSNPYTDRVMMIVLESGEAKVGAVGDRVAQPVRGLSKGVRGRPAPGLRGGRDDGYRQHSRIRRGLLRRHRV